MLSRCVTNDRCTISVAQLGFKHMVKIYDCAVLLLVNERTISHMNTEGVMFLECTINVNKAGS